MNTETMTYGYCRVSTREQNLDRQIIAMKEFGVEEKNIFMEKMSGKNFDRPVFLRLVHRLKKGDTLVIKSIDRLGRNYKVIQEQWRLITKVICANIVVLDMPLLDTREDKNLTGIMIADLVLQILAYVAETERSFILQRQKEGIAAAKDRGVKFGAEKKPLPENFNEVYEQWFDGKISARTAAKMTQVAHTTFLKWAREKRGVA